MNPRSAPLALFVARVICALLLFSSPAISGESPKANAAKVYGKIQVVDSFPDYKVRIVSRFPDLKVQVVKSFPNAPGKWRFVDKFPDFKIKFVESGEDFTIQYVKAFPGPGN